MKHALTAGQTLWYVPTRGYGEPREVTVEKVSRKYATLAHNQGRIALDTLAVDGAAYVSPGTCYLSREIWQEEKRLDVAWSRFRRLVERTYSPPVGATVEHVAQAAASLGLPLSLNDRAD